MKNSSYEKNSLREKRMKLQRQLEEYTKKDVCVAFSGGVDSSLVLLMACEAAEKNNSTVYAVTMDTVLHPKADLDSAHEVLKKTNAVSKVIHLDELTVPEIKYNPTDRCYLCKLALYGKLLAFAQEKGAGAVLEGSNEDDLHVYRPGLRAVRELGIKSPLADCAVTKAEVRILAREYEIPVADRPSAPCLATRLPYGAELDLALLGRIERGEEYLRHLGLSNVRIRVHGEILRLETDRSGMALILEKREEITERLRQVGCDYITLDLEGFRSGSMDLHVKK